MANRGLHGHGEGRGAVDASVQPRAAARACCDRTGDLMPTWNHAAWLAKRYADAQTMPAPKPRAEIALPGAKRAIQHDRLLAHHGLDRGEHEIVALENERWERE